MGNRLSVSSPVVLTESVEELFDTLSALPLSIHCLKCGTKLLHVHATFVSASGKVWTLPLPICPNCEPPQIRAEGSDTTSLRQKRNFVIQFNETLSSGPSLSKALPSTTPSGPTWEQLYQRATVELDHTKLLERISDARHEFRIGSKRYLLSPGTERRALNNTFKTLRMLEEVAARERPAA